MPFAITNLGNIKGRRSKTKNNSTFFAFYKIPFAKPPTKRLRFALPLPVDPWQGTLDCSKKEAVCCLQVNVVSPESKFLIGSEDCLYMNIYTPHLPEPAVNVVFPVIVWIHGGAFCVGSNDHRLYGPDYLVDQGVVVVAVNYRLGPLGFLSLDNDACPGNQGLHDQLMALKWVRDNILSFGGDPKNVTIMGESAGAMSCFYHFVSPLSRGLFHKVIALSGSATTPFLHNDRQSSMYARTLNHALGGSISDSNEEILDRLQSMSARNIVQKTTVFKDWDVTNPLPWKPIVDGHASTPFLPMSFNESIKKGNFPVGVPFIAGFTSEEGLILSAPFHRSLKRWSLLFSQWERWAPLLFFNRETDLINKKDIEAVDAIRRRFFRASDVLSTTVVPPFNEQNLKLVEQMFSTAIFQAPLCRDLDLMVEHGVKVFGYHFAYTGSMTLTELFRLPTMKLLFNFSGRHLGAKIFQKNLGACHGDDLLYIFPFNVFGFPKSLRTEADRRVSSNMLKFFTNFAKRGDPNEDQINIEWKPLDTTHSKRFLTIGEDLQLEDLDQSLKSRIDFWNQLIREAGHSGWTPSAMKISRIYNETADNRIHAFAT